MPQIVVSQQHFFHYFSLKRLRTAKFMLVCSKLSLFKESAYKKFGLEVRYSLEIKVVTPAITKKNESPRTSLFQLFQTACNADNTQTVPSSGLALTRSPGP
jgi:hypothetical protein